MSAEDHTCAVEDCGRRVLPREFMCYPHWFTLSPAHRRRVMRFRRHPESAQYAQVTAEALESLKATTP